VTDEDRYDRQRRLREVGARGQARIERATATLGTGPETSVAVAYLVRAGVPRVIVENAPSKPIENVDWFRFSAPRVVASGALLALQHLLSSIETE
jgi:hypothetical protein